MQLLFYLHQMEIKEGNNLRIAISDSRGVAIALFNIKKIKNNIVDLIYKADDNDYQGNIINCALIFNFFGGTFKFNINNNKIKHGTFRNSNNNEYKAIADNAMQTKF